MLSVAMLVLVTCKELGGLGGVIDGVLSVGCVGAGVIVGGFVSCVDGDRTLEGCGMDGDRTLEGCGMGSASNTSPVVGDLSEAIRTYGLWAVQRTGVTQAGTVSDLFQQLRRTSMSSSRSRTFYTTLRSQSCRLELAHVWAARMLLKWSRTLHCGDPLLVPDIVVLLLAAACIVCPTPRIVRCQAQVDGDRTLWRAAAWEWRHLILGMLHARRAEM